MAFRKRGFLKKKAAVAGEVPQPAGNKYGVSAKEDRTWEGRLYASKLEMNFHKVLLEHFPADQIHIQIPFVLQPSFRLPFDKELRREVRYISDFVIGDKPEGNLIHPGSVVIDSKGFRTPDFNILKKLFEYATGHPLQMLKSIKILKQQIPTFKAMQQIDLRLIATLSAGPFIVTGYTSSDGTVSHKKFRIIGREGYLDLVRASLELLPTIAPRIVSEAVEAGFGTLTERDLDGCVEALETSLKKKLEDKEQPSDEAAQITPSIAMFDGKPDHVIVLRLEELEKLVIAEGAATKPKKPTASAFKAILEAQLPIHRYVHRINLYPGKYTDVQPA
jgi:hypothetical protein